MLNLAKCQIYSGFVYYFLFIFFLLLRKPFAWADVEEASLKCLKTTINDLIYNINEKKSSDKKALCVT